MGKRRSWVLVKDSEQSNISVSIPVFIWLSRIFLLPFHFARFQFQLCYVMLCYVMLCYVMLCYVVVMLL